MTCARLKGDLDCKSLLPSLMQGTLVLESGTSGFFPQTLGCKIKVVQIPCLSPYAGVVSPLLSTSRGSNSNPNHPFKPIVAIRDLLKIRMLPSYLLSLPIVANQLLLYLLFNLETEQLCGLQHRAQARPTPHASSGNASEARSPAAWPAPGTAHLCRERRMQMFQVGNEEIRGMHGVAESEGNPCVVVALFVFLPWFCG